MIHYIENENIKIGVKEYGCELTSVFSKKDGYEYIWYGDENIWYGQSPILFPIVGRLIDDKYTLDGIEYNMPKHGFARKTDWTLLEKTENSLSFILQENASTLSNYPYKFDLIVKFEITGCSLSVTHTVKNKNEKTMYFSLGAHPGFNCKIGDILRFDVPETLSTEKIDLVRSLRLPDTFSILEDSTEIEITEHIFDEDALILHGIKSEHITLIRKENGKNVRFSLGGAPYLGIWAKPGAPYVCIEPWFGVNDSTEKKNDFSEKDAINSLDSGKIFSFTWKADFSE